MTAMPRTKRLEDYPFRLDFTPFRRVRRASGISLASLSKATGLSYWTLHRIENNTGTPSIVQMVALAQQMGVPLHQLFTVHPRNTPNTGDAR